MSPEETFQKLVEANGLKGADSIPIEKAREMFCSHLKYEEQAHGDIEKLYNDHMQNCHAEEHMRAPVGMIESSLKEGFAIHFPRYSGKTRALLNFVERMPSSERFAFIGERAETLRLARTQRRLEGSPLGTLENVHFFAADDAPSCFSPLRSFRYVVVDEWWSLKKEFREFLGSEFRVIAAVGTIRPGTEFRIVGQNDSRFEQEVERKVKERLYEEIVRYTRISEPFYKLKP